MFKFLKQFILKNSKPSRYSLTQPLAECMTFKTAKTHNNEYVFAIGDIHGRADLLVQKIEQVKSKIAAISLEQTTKFHLVLVGDYIDRGQQSRKVIKTLMKLQIDNCTIHCLMGNHEDIFLKFLSKPHKYFKTWMAIGGAATLSSFGINNVDEYNAEQIKADLLAAMGMKMFGFISELKSSYTNGDYFFCHAVPKSSLPLNEQAKKILIYNRKESAPYYSKIVIHGHVAGNEVTYDGSKINIDTGAYATENLTCLLVYNYNQIVL